MDEEKYKILIADDNETVVNILISKLKNEGYLIFKAVDGYDALEKINNILPDLVILDILMPKIDGFKVKEELSKNSTTADIPVVFLTGQTEVNHKVKGFRLGADDYITKPFKNEELIARISAILRKKKYYEQMALTDGLTSLNNIAYFNKHFPIFFDMAQRYNTIFSLLIIDVNKFKEINDTYGHNIGDIALKTIADILMSTLRKSDVVVRYGGDEFAVILPGASNDIAHLLIERLKKSISEKEIKIDKETNIHLSVSIGCAAYSDGFINTQKMFEAADKNMYEDKELSQNFN